MIGGTNSVIISLDALFPVGAMYIGTMQTCPLIALMPGTTWTLIDTDAVSGKNTWERTV